MTDIVERLQDMFYRFGRESPEDAANRRIQTAKDAADEIEKLRAALDKAADALHDAGCYDAWAAARATLGKKV